MRKSKRSVYQNIAFDLASRIASNDLVEGVRLSGRTVLSSEYGVSPETIRRAMSLLQEQGVVEIKNNAGVVVISKVNALKYLQSMGSVNDATELKHTLGELMDRRKELDDEIDRVINQLVDLSGRFSNTDPLRRFEYVIPKKSHLVGKTIRDSQFFQHTKMTIVALNKMGDMILSPGPDALFEEGDVLVVMGNIDDGSALEQWMQGDSSNQA